MDIYTREEAVGYSRVSSKEQEETGYSLPAQEKSINEYAARKENNFRVVKIFPISESASGKVRRKIFDEMMNFVRKRGISKIIVETTDRLTRNFTDVMVIDAWVLENEKNQIHLIKEGCILHKNSKSHEWFMWRVKVATAEFYVRLLSENVKKGQKEKLAQGWIPMKPKLGYKTIGEKGHKIHVINEEKAPQIKKLFELYATGNYSLKALTGIMYNEGLRNDNGNRVVKSRIHKLLSDPYYRKKNKWNGEITDGAHEIFIPVELFDLVQAKLKRKIGHPQYKKHLPVFKAKVFCKDCNGTITWYIQKGHWYGQHNNYCECPQRANGCLRQEAVEDQLFPYFDKVAPKNERVLQWLEKALKESHEGEIEYNTRKRDELTKIIQRADKRIEGAYKDKLDGKMPGLCEKIMAESTDEKERAIYSLKNLSEARTAYYEAGYAIHELALKAKDIYKSPKATTEEKRLLLSYMFSDISLKDRKINANYSLAFEFLAKWMPKLNKILEPTQNPTESEVLRGVAVTTPVGQRLESLEPLNKFRTSKNSHLKPRFGLTDAKSRLLLRG